MKKISEQILSGYTDIFCWIREILAKANLSQGNNKKRNHCLQKSVQKLRKISYKLQFRDRIENIDPGYQVASCERADNINSFTKQRDKMSQGESFLGVVLRKRYQDTLNFVSFIPNFLSFWIQWYVY